MSAGVSVGRRSLSLDVRRLRHRRGNMKMNTERLLILTEHWASCAIAFGLGCWILSALNHEAAVLVAFAIVPVGALAKLITHSRLKHLYGDPGSSGSPPAS